MNRRIRNRTYGGVRGRREQSRLLLDSDDISRIEKGQLWVYLLQFLWIKGGIDYVRRV